jgi:hypothetical protein
VLQGSSEQGGVRTFNGIPFAYLCECSSQSCRREVRLLHSRYLELASYGTVVHPDCVTDSALLVTEEVAVLATSVPIAA